MNKGLVALERNRNFIERYFVKQTEETGVYHKDMKDEMLNDLSTIEKELKEYQEIKDIAKRYNWDAITSKIFNVETDKKYRDLFDSAIVNIQEDYRKARALEIIKRISYYDAPFLDYVLDESKITKEEYDLLKEVFYGI